MRRDELKPVSLDPTEPQPQPNPAQPLFTLPPRPTKQRPGRLTQARASAMLRLEGGLRLVTDVQAAIFFFEWVKFMKFLGKCISSLETKAANISPLKIGLLPQKESSFPNHYKDAKMLVSGKILRERSFDEGEKSSLKNDNFEFGGGV